MTNSLTVSTYLGGRADSRLGSTKPANQIPESELICPALNNLFKWVNGKLEPKDKNNPSLIERTNGYPQNITKAVWPLVLPLQLIGLVNDKFEDLSRAMYGLCWSVVYTVNRPWKNDRTKITFNAQGDIPEAYKKFDTINEYFRVIMGTVVSAVYGSGALGMLFGWLKGDEDFYDKSVNVYKTGMLNQNQIFASMNAGIVLRRHLLKKGLIDKNQLSEYDREENNIKAKVELVDTVMFLPNIAARALDTLKMFGLNVMNEGVERFVNFLGYFSYGTWAARFGYVKTIETSERGMGALDPINPKLEGNAAKIDKALHYTQKYSGHVFSTLLPTLSWVAACGELFGLEKLANKAFKLEGICERLTPTVFSWCRDIWLNLLEKKE